jgi:protein-tyrosine-phosphatase/DNA-binding HxlR family transcriptional regulator
MTVEVSPRAFHVEDRAALHAALADPIRLAIVDELGASDRTPTELGRLTGTPSNLVAHHLRVLEHRGIVERRRSIGDGRRAYLRLVSERLEVLIVRQVLEAETVLFVCTRNSARSQLAAAMWNRGPRAIRAESAGTHPDGRVHPGALLAARRRGLDLSRAAPRDLGDVAVRRPLIVTVCDQAREELGRRVAIHWSVADPVVTGTREAFDAAADEISQRVEQLGWVIGSTAERAALEKEVG